MIDPQLLKGLGWNDALIDEVNRVATIIDTAAPTQPVREGPLFHAAIQTSVSTAFTVDADGSSQIKQTG